MGWDRTHATFPVCPSCGHRCEHAFTMEGHFGGNGNKPVTTSLKVAEYFGKQHFHVLRDIGHLDCSAKFRESNFGVSTYKVPGQSKKYPFYEMTRDGFMFLVMGFNGKKAAHIKESFIEAFNMLEEKVRAITLDERKRISDLLRANSTMLIEQDNTIREMAPKVEVHDHQPALSSLMTTYSAHTRASGPTTRLH